MGRFDALLVIPGDPEPLLAILVVDDGRLRIKAASHEIGDWPLEEVALTSIPSGFHMKLGDEELIVEIDDRDTFNHEVTADTKKRGRRRRTNDPETGNATRRPERSARRANGRPANRKKHQAPPRRSGRTASKTESQPDRGYRELAKNFGTRLDRVLAKAEKKYGPLLPPWIFTRGTPAVLGIGLLVLILFPGFVSTMLLLAGFLGVVFGAVLYTDGALAARVLPGRSTATHVLIGGVGLVFLGVLLALIAK